MDKVIPVQYVDYFGSRKTLPEGYVEVSIARGTPVWFKGDKMEDIAPSWELVHGYKDGSISDEAYTSIYISQLMSRQDALQSIVNSIVNDKKRYVFKCHCGKGKFCHRFIWKDVLERVGIPVREL